MCLYNRRIVLGKKHVNILAIESSCDETAAAVVANGKQIRSSVVASQVKLHEKFGGVVPEIASRAHVEKIFADCRRGHRAGGDYSGRN